MYQRGVALVLVCATVMFLYTPEARAQRMYRCGNAYQDRPCEGEQAGKEVRNFGGSSSSSRAVADPQCARLGEDSMKVSWAREGGVTKEQQLAERPADQWLIETVYLRRGTAQEIRTAVEASCMADKERQAAAARAQGTTALPLSSPQGPPDDDMARFQERRDAEIAANQEAFRKSRCTDLKRQYDSLAQQERAGGSSATMQRLRDRRHSLDERRSSEGC